MRGGLPGLQKRCDIFILMLSTPACSLFEKSLGCTFMMVAVFSLYTSIFKKLTHQNQSSRLLVKHFSPARQCARDDGELQRRVRCCDLRNLLEI